MISLKLPPKKVVESLDQVLGGVLPGDHQLLLLRPLGGCPDLHFHTLHGTQIYKKPNLLETQIYTSPNLLETQIYTKPNLPMTLIYTKIYTKPDLHRSKFTQNPYLHRPQIYKNPNLHIDKNSKEGQTYAIFLKSPWYEDLKSNSPGCLTCKYTNTASVKVPHRPNICYIFGKPLEQGPQNQ